ncbi:type II toxin-antitoxin system HigB family toxin [Chloroflexota bacterium]
MRVISVRKLRDCWQDHRDVEGALKSWHAEVKSAQWNTPDDVKQRYPSADILPGNRVVFNIKGNHYRLVVKIHYNTGIVYIRFVGTHAVYDNINAEII